MPLFGVWFFIIEGKSCIAFVISALISEAGEGKGRQSKSKCEVTEYTPCLTCIVTCFSSFCVLVVSFSLGAADDTESCHVGRTML